jgi:hypothetical protein
VCNCQYQRLPTQIIADHADGFCRHFSNRLLTLLQLLLGAPAHFWLWDELHSQKASTKNGWFSKIGSSGI